MLYNYHLYLAAKHFHPPDGNPTPTSSPPHPPLPSPWQPQISFLPLWLRLLWTFRINGTIQSITLSVWFLSLGRMFPGFFHVSCVNSFLRLNTIFWYGQTTCCYPFIIIHSADGHLDSSTFSPLCIALLGTFAYEFLHVPVFTSLGVEVLGQLVIPCPLDFLKSKQWFKPSSLPLRQALYNCYCLWSLLTPVRKG